MEQVLRPENDPLGIKLRSNANIVKIRYSPYGTLLESLWLRQVTYVEIILF
jgi:hypothetical protein